MWSGEGSEQFAGGGQWLNPMMYQNVSNDQVDWASLAQQWIQMKETFPSVDQMNALAPPPPPPPTNKKEEAKDEKKDEGEKGEAPMDMELDSKEEENGLSKGSMMGTNGSVDGWGSDWNQWQQWGWGGWNAAMPGAAVYPMSGYGEGGEGAVSYPQVDATGKHTRGQGFPPQGSQFMRHPNRVWRRGDKTIRGNYRPNSRDRSESPDQPVIDAAKRKTLPAWIREGLEKMEREKQKKLIQEQEKLAREAKKKEEGDQFDPLNPTKSKFDTDSEHSDAEEHESERDNKSVHLSPSHTVDRRAPSPPPPLQRKLSKAEILENVMGIVRKQLTQLLMRVTSEEIEKCAQEVFSVFPGLKAQHQSAHRPTASRSLKGNLGLGIYDDSATESSESEGDGESATNSHSAYQNEDVLRDLLNQKKRDFSRVEREIEMKIQVQEENERRAALQEEEEDEDSEEEDEGREIEDQVHRQSEDHPADIEQSGSEDEAEVAGSRNPHKSQSPRYEEEKSSKRRDEDSVEKDRRDRSYSRDRDEASRKRENSYESARRDSTKAREDSENSDREKKRKKKKKKRDSSRSRKGSEESRRSDRYRESSRDKYRDSSRDKYRDSSRDKYKYGESNKDKYRDSSRDKYKYGESSKDKYRDSSRDYRSRDRYRESSRDKYSESSRHRDSSRDSRRSKKRHRSRSSSAGRSRKSSRSKRYDSDDSRTSRKKSRYSESPDRRKKKKRSRSRSRSYSYSSSNRRH